MAHDTVLTAFVIVVVAAIVLQALAMFGIHRSVQGIRREVEGLRADVKQRLDPLTQTVTEILASSREPARAILSNLAEVTRIVRDRTGHVDLLVEDLVDKTRLQIIRVDQLVSSMVDKIESTTDRVQQGVLAPIQEVAAVIKGVRTGLEFLFARRRATTASETTQDEQLFI